MTGSSHRRLDLRASCDEFRGRLRGSQSEQRPPLLAEFEEHIDRCSACFEAVVERYVPASNELPNTRQAVGRYELGAVLGAGAGGTVYDAHDPILNRNVAVKVLRATGSERARVRMLREAQAMARLDHPNVVRVYDAGEYERCVYIAMERIEGRCLDEYVRAERSSWRDVTSLCLQAGRGLVVAHAAGLVHRDFKPSNVMVDEHGRVVVTDFGLASGLQPVAPQAQTHEDAALLGLSLTATDALVGTPVYMAPERLEGEPATPDTDQYAWSVSMFELLTGTRPFEGRTLAELKAAQRRLAPDLHRRVPGPRALGRVVSRELSFDPGERAASMAELLAEVERILGGRRRYAVGGIGLVLLAGAAALGRGPQRPPRCEEPLRGVEIAALDPRTLAGTRLRNVADRLATAYGEVCSTMPREPRSAVPREHARWLCLEATRHQLDVVVDELLREKELDRPSLPWWQIRRPEDCIDASLAYQSSYLGHVEPTAALTALEFELAAVRAVVSRDPVDAERRLEPLLAQAEKLAIPPLIVDASSTRARALALQGRNDDALAELYRAYDLAAKHELARESGRIALALAAHTSRAFRLEESKVWIRAAEPLLTAEEDQVEIQQIKGRIAFRDGRFEAAIEHFDDAEALAERSFASIDWNFSTLAVDRGLAWLNLGEYPKAAAELERALAGSLEVTGPEGPEVANRALNLASAELMLGEPDAAVEHLELARSAIGDADPSTSTYIELNMGIANTNRGQFESAHDSLQRAEALARDALPEVVPLVLVNQAATAGAQGKFEVAIESTRRAIRVAQDVYAENPQQRLTLVGFALTVAARIDRVDPEFQSLLRDAMEERARILDGELSHQAQAGLSWARGLVALHSGAPDRAGTAFEQALDQLPVDDREFRALLAVDLARATEGVAGSRMLEALAVSEDLVFHEWAWVQIRRARAMRERGLVADADALLDEVERACAREGLDHLATLAARR